MHFSLSLVKSVLADRIIQLDWPGQLKTRLFVAALFLFCFCRAQNEVSKWYFGANAGLDFMTSPPTVLTNGMVNVHEGSYCISDHLAFFVISTSESRSVFGECVCT